MIILCKVAITILVVSALSIIAERISPRAAGILSGYPLGSAISLFFIGLEQGQEFAGTSAIYNVAGLTGLLSFFLVYYLVSKPMQQHGLPRRVVIPVSSLIALFGFLAVSSALHALNLPAWACALVGAAGVYGFGVLFRHIPDRGIAQRVRLNPLVLLFRAVLAALVILAITGVAHLVPPSWAGLFSAFPATVFPLLLILHTTYGAEQAYTVIKNLPSGLWSLVLYSLTVSYTYPNFGIYWGTLIGFGVATVYLLGFAAITGAFSMRAARAQAGKTVKPGEPSAAHGE